MAVVSAPLLAGLRIDATTLVGAVAILVGAVLVARAARLVLVALADRFVEQGAAIQLAIPLTKFLIYGVAAYSVLGPLFQLSQTQALAFSGVLGAALGLGLKDLLGNVVGGLVVVFETPYQVGDRIELGDYYGEVVDVGVRATRLQTPDDNLVAVPNYLALTESVANANAGSPEMLVVTELFVANDADAERARTIVEDAVYTSRHLAPERPVTVFVEANPRYRTIRAKAYVNDLDAQFAFESDVTRRALRQFDAEGIRTPPATLIGD
ncbi:Small-conductance mechanosensitive channel [Haloplanus vescus]|uniref:Small-conductance mechanosensitive channel n=1 Tax=Haloplanus vescus TaxID=555874 RepID=A0A1H3YD46_9EURY|nr:Small-conductance mechanosensitive channel [Haloplanus vescus]